jgi:ubiquinone/menaquinone biosynthesis C-methylase UbiE
MFRSADAYDLCAGRYGASLSEALIEFARVEPGMRALDVGCGPGALTTALAERLGAANVTAVDPSEPFADACRERLPGVEVALAKRGGAAVRDWKLRCRALAARGEFHERRRSRRA